MKTKTQKIISLVLATIAGFIDYIGLTIIKSLCYYAGGGQGNFLELQNACYAKYSASRFLTEIIFVSLAVYLVTFYVLKIFRDRKTKKFKNIR